MPNLCRNHVRARLKVYDHIILALEHEIDAPRHDQTREYIVEAKYLIYKIRRESFAFRKKHDVF